MDFRYKPLEVRPSKSSARKSVVFRPIIPVYLIGSKKMVDYEALIDSGADYNVFHSEIADILGIRYKNGKKRRIFGLGDQEIKGYECDVEIKLQGFGKYAATIIFSNQIPENSYGVLGSKRFFDRYLVSFNYPGKVISISRSKIQLD